MVVLINVNTAYSIRRHRAGKGSRILWYDQVHVPEILACPGWLKASRYLCVEGGPKYAAVYEIDGPQAYETPEFNAVKGFGPFTEDVSNFRRICLTPIG